MMFVLLSLAGCSTPSWLCLFPPGPGTVTLVTTPTTNGGNAIAVALVMVSDKAAATQIGTLSADAFFTQQSQLQRDFPNDFVVRTWGLAPGQAAQDQPVNGPCNRVSTLLFARYASPGDHRQVLTGQSAITVTLGDGDFSVGP
jgi:hypothetical protein